MFKYTKAAINLMINDFKKIANFFKVTFILFSLTYYIFSIITNKGNLVINIVLLSIMILYSIFEITTINIDNEKLKYIAKRIFSISKIIVKSISLGVVIYSLYLISEVYSPVSIVILTLTIILWVLQVLLELCIIIFNKYKEYILVAVEKDKQNISIGANIAIGGVPFVIEKIKNKKKKRHTNLTVLEKLEKQISKEKNNK